MNAVVAVGVIGRIVTRTRIGRATIRRPDRIGVRLRKGRRCHADCQQRSGDKGSCHEDILL
ncbi:hypothetical protein RHECNPAF_1740079 [Rhizobium etli CNPAF512]|nr:hypothetical protein RHECNPAF_1740079 [Rhizobium etli CNPAF512]